MVNRKKIIVQRQEDSHAKPNFAIYRMPNSEEIMIVMQPVKGKRTMTVLEDTETALALAIRLFEFVDKGG